jgi:hypothetical protein
MDKIVLYIDSDVEVYITWIEELQGINIHSTVRTWSLSKYKKYISVLSIILLDFKSKGIKKVYAVPPTEKEEKWEALFGFKDSGLRTICKHKIMELEIWD